MLHIDSQTVKRCASKNRLNHLIVNILHRDCRLMFSIWPKQPTDPIHSCVRVTKFTFLYLIPVVSAGFFVYYLWQGCRSPANAHFYVHVFVFRQVPAVLSALYCPPAAPRLPCGCRRRCTGFPSTCVPVSFSYSFLQVRSSLPSHGAEAASSSCPIRYFQTLTYRGHKNRTPRIQYLVLFQQNFVLWHADLFCDSSKFSFARPAGGILFLRIKDTKYSTH